MILFLALGAVATPVILSDNTSAATSENILATSSSKSSSKSNSSKKSTKNQQKSDENNDAESSYADPQGVKKSLDDSMNTMQDVSSKFSTGLTILVVALIATPVLGLIFAIVRQALKSH